MRGKHPYRTKLPNVSHQLEHVGPNKQISEVQADLICYFVYIKCVIRLDSFKGLAFPLTWVTGLGTTSL